MAAKKGKRKRSDQPGFVRKVGPNKYRVGVTAGYNAEGRQLQRTETITGSLSDAQHARAQMVAQYGKPGKLDTGSLTVVDLLQLYAKVVSTQNGWAPRTITETDRFIGYLDPIHDVPMGDLTPTRCQEVAALLGKHLAPSSTKRIMGVLKAAYNWALAQNMVKSNPALAVKIAVPTKLAQAAPKASVAALLESLWEEDPQMHAVVRLAATTGARRGEILGLKWTDVTTEPAKIVFRRTVAEGAHGPEVKEGLKASASKTVNIDKDTLAALDPLRSTHVDVGFIISDDGGVTPWRPSRVTKAYRRWQRQLEIDCGRFHDLRHLHASYLLGAGHPVNLVAARLGHASPNVTLSVYAHVLPGQDEAAASIAGDAFPLPTSS